MAGTFKSFKPGFQLLSPKMLQLSIKRCPKSRQITRKYLQTNICSCFWVQSSDSELEALWSHQAPRVRTRENGTRADPRAEPLQPAEQHETPSEDGYEVMNGIGAEAASLKTNVVVLKESSSQQAVNLILSFGGGGDSQVQVLDLPVQTDADGGEQPLELVHRVRSSTSRDVPAHHSAGSAVPSFTWLWLHVCLFPGSLL